MSDLVPDSERTGLYLIPLAGITWAATTDILRNRSLRTVNLVLGCALLIQFATQVQFRSFEIWSYNSAIKDIARKLQHETIGNSVRSVSVSADSYKRRNSVRLVWGPAATGSTIRSKYRLSRPPIRVYSSP